MITSNNIIYTHSDLTNLISLNLTQGEVNLKDESGQMHSDCPGLVSI